MTFLRSSDVKNHLYTGSSRKRRLLSKDINPDEKIETPSLEAMGVLVPANAHPAIARVATGKIELASVKQEPQTEHKGNTLHLVSKAKQAA